MWIAIQILTCVTIILAACFLVGKKVGQRRFLKMQEEMRALEKAFNQLLEQMELVSGHNLKVLDTKTQELRELLNVADKKCLYANDLMKEVDDMKRELQNHNRTAAIVPPASPLGELKIRRELQEMIDETNAQVRNITLRIQQLEQDRTEIVDQLDRLLLAERVRPESRQSFPPEPAAPAHPRTETAGPVPPTQPAAPRTFAASDWQTAQPEPPAAMPEPAPFPGVSFPAAELPSPAPELRQTAINDADIIDRIRLRHLPEDTFERAAMHPGMDAQEYEAFKQVLQLRDQGYSIPQIARQLRMSKGEIELLMKFYELRKVV